ncbi:hypothetical protein AX774_g1942 [Zancudomyces culisetae]|uniref:Uncharacterized protein n=1 Tax=Zancudomyces culisetae TaxID=1213189 RepID=A0A1R1PUC1_ZANCU|nr:hypothetical protein AX774_g1942 [Zancudomyces culisetae]|eukprot:OMH84537.1 hypothetical protein AX774_g1942 [Zancudomyces culisetae]
MPFFLPKNTPTRHQPNINGASIVFAVTYNAKTFESTLVFASMSIFGVYKLSEWILLVGGICPFTKLRTGLFFSTKDAKESIVKVTTTASPQKSMK